MNGWMAFFFLMLSLHVCAFTSIPRYIETHAHTLKQTKRSKKKKQETKEHDEEQKSCTQLIDESG